MQFTWQLIWSLDVPNIYQLNSSCTDGVTAISGSVSEVSGAPAISLARYDL